MGFIAFLKKESVMEIMTVLSGLALIQATINYSPGLRSIL
jgi:hypothetical protein